MLLFEELFGVFWAFLFFTFYYMEGRQFHGLCCSVLNAMLISMLDFMAFDQFFSYRHYGRVKVLP